MEGANAFVIQAVNEMAVRQHHLDEKRRQRGALQRARGLPTRTVAEVVVAVAASAVIALMVAVGGAAGASVIDDACPIGGPTACAPPNPLTICRQINGQELCLDEPT